MRRTLDRARLLYGSHRNDPDVQHYLNQPDQRRHRIVPVLPDTALEELWTVVGPNETILTAMVDPYGVTFGLYCLRQDGTDEAPWDLLIHPHRHLTVSDLPHVGDVRPGKPPEFR